MAKKREELDNSGSAFISWVDRHRDDPLHDLIAWADKLAQRPILFVWNSPTNFKRWIKKMRLNYLQRRQAVKDHPKNVAIIEDQRRVIQELRTGAEEGNKEIERFQTQLEELAKQFRSVSQDLAKETRIRKSGTLERLAAAKAIEPFEQLIPELGILRNADKPMTLKQIKEHARVTTASMKRLTEVGLVRQASRRPDTWTSC